MRKAIVILFLVLCSVLSFAKSAQKAKHGHSDKDAPHIVYNHGLRPAYKYGVHPAFKAGKWLVGF